MIAYLFIAFSFFTKNKNKILIYNLLNTILFIAAYIFLEAKAGIIINSIGILRCVWFYLDFRFAKKKDYFSLIISTALIVVFTAVFWTSWIDIFPIIAGVLFTYSIWQNNVAFYRWSMVICSICWICYNSFLLSITSIALESDLFLIELNSILHYYIVDKYNFNGKMFYKARAVYKKDKSGHSFDHIIRVLILCRKLQRKEGGDWFVISIAALFHDIHRILSNEKGRFVSPEESIETIKKMLKPYDIEKEKLEKILYIIENHEKKQDFEFDIIEAKIVVDADILDGLGKRGLKRTLQYGKDKGLPLESEIDINTKEYIPDVNPISTKHYVYRTLLPNSKNMKTQTGEKLSKLYAEKLEKLFNKKLKICQN